MIADAMPREQAARNHFQATYTSDVIRRNILGTLARFNSESAPDPLASFGEVLIASDPEYQLFLVSNSNRSLYAHKYIAGNAFDQLICNAGEAPVELQLFTEQHAEGQTSYLRRDPSKVLPKYGALFLERGIRTYLLGHEQDQLLLVMRSLEALAYYAMYDSASLMCIYKVCRDPGVIDSLLLLKTLNCMKIKCDEAVLKMLEQHSDPSIRLACARHRLIVDPAEGMANLQRLVKSDEQLKNVATRWISKIIAKRK
ncbi:hypothetical protein [Bradyrhizobium sp. AZCC 1699]|uniref:hypothetical protein n=1 Tax=Bradyrhizobium sp. AZCC 1699 TaxID=3117024 RepID=UPI002FF13CFB